MVKMTVRRLVEAECHRAGQAGDYLLNNSCNYSDVEFIQKGVKLMGRLSDCYEMEPYGELNTVRELLYKEVVSRLMRMEHITL